MSQWDTLLSMAAAMKDPQLWDEVMKLLAKLVIPK